jgi:hypothetical protein
VFGKATSLIPPTTPEQMREGILYIQQLLHSRRLEGSLLLALRERYCESCNSPSYDIIVERGKTQYNALRIGSSQHEPIKCHRFDPLSHCR